MSCFLKAFSVKNFERKKRKFDKKRISWETENLTLEWRTKLGTSLTSDDVELIKYVACFPFILTFNISKPALERPLEHFLCIKRNDFPTQWKLKKL